MSKPNIASLTLEVNNLQVEVAAHLRKIADLTKQLEQQRSTATGHWENYQRKSQEIELVHTLLDQLPNPPPSDQPNGYGAKLPLAVRVSLALLSRTEASK